MRLSKIIDQFFKRPNDEFKFGETENCEVIKFFTDTATIAIFDNAILKSRYKDDVDWWCGDLSDIDEIKHGKICVVSTCSDGYYFARVTDGELRQTEKDYAKCVIKNMGFEVKSGTIFIGKGECLPGDKSKTTIKNIQDGDGRIFSIENGLYDVDIYLIEWFNSPDYWNNDYIRPEGAPVDFVLKIRKRTEPFSEIKEEPRLISEEKFLFESRTRKVGPEVGMIIESKVLKSTNGLVVNNSGPLSYKPVIKDFKDIKWKDKVRLKVVSVDHEQQQIEVEFIEKI